MPKVYSAIEGLKVMIQGYGIATFEECVVVPEDVANDVEKDKRVRVDRDEPKRSKRPFRASAVED